MLFIKPKLKQDLERKRAPTMRFPVLRPELEVGLREQTTEEFLVVSTPWFLPGGDEGKSWQLQYLVSIVAASCATGPSIIANRSTAETFNGVFGHGLAPDGPLFVSQTAANRLLPSSPSYPTWLGFYIHW